MEAMYIGRTEPGLLTKGRTYDVIAKEGELFRIVDDSGQENAYSKSSFVVMNGDDEE
ncbi:MAG: hypothetical protein ACOYJB_05345 [Christensenellaceae bacterium]|jgi:hypothetical protein